jgi:antitoxin VapB
MALSIKNKELEETARELARLTGKSITEAALEGLKRELERQKGIKRIMQSSSKDFDDPLAAIRDIQQRYAALPSTSTLTDDEVLGYDEFGAPTR